MVLTTIGDVELSDPDLERRDAEAEGGRWRGVDWRYWIVQNALLVVRVMYSSTP